MTDLDKLRLIRDEALKLNTKINSVEKIKQDLTLQLLTIQNNCNHNIVVRYQNNETGREIRCLCCNKGFYGRLVGLDFYFDNIIDLNLETDEDKVNLALELFIQEKQDFPDLSDTEIVKIINHKIQNNLYKKEQGIIKVLKKEDNN